MLIFLKSVWWGGFFYCIPSQCGFHSVRVLNRHVVASPNGAHVPLLSWVTLASSMGQRCGSARLALVPHKLGAAWNVLQTL